MGSICGGQCCGDDDRGYGQQGYSDDDCVCCGCMGGSSQPRGYNPGNDGNGGYGRPPGYGGYGGNWDQGNGQGHGHGNGYGNGHGHWKHGS